MKQLTLITLALIVFGCEKEQKQNVYKTIEINGLIWMAENLKETTLNDGTPILMEDGTPYDLNTYPYFDANLFGYLYNYTAVESGLLCPVGWRMPTIQDYESLVIGIEEMGSATKLQSIDFWLTPGTNEIGFNAYGTGWVLLGEYKKYLEATAFWSVSNYEEDRINIVALYDNDPFIFWANSKKTNYLSVRCIKSIN
ncbi:MAG: hypothetical protein KGZ97_07810 [Bacteroidetes bacterium]|nr:hypothetical protein [Bacteroidota bacterium]